jgi:hypothetical protein
MPFAGIWEFFPPSFAIFPFVKRESKPMSLDDQEKKELAKKIREQRRSVWKGETTSGRRTANRGRPGDSGQEPQQEQTSESHKNFVEGDEEASPALQDTLSTELTSDAQAGEAKSRIRDTILKPPKIGLALLVIIGLIAAMSLGAAIGYLLASMNLVKL